MQKELAPRRVEIHRDALGRCKLNIETGFMREAAPGRIVAHPQGEAIAARRQLDAPIDTRRAAPRETASPVFEREPGFSFATNFLFPAAGLLNYR
jgi:hypothetical protein